ncbi:hypothetical protein BDZ94DRAFT_1326661 [Collybia nuda]|uniref:Uncharacterized protein n=1 Tax=Collybia nuda TaxID=64659 RepID=A0A9P5XW90_9AGAR|nr:hypothetical protein BDZ94DRAFT_1326661 [Collybia nuda]
MAENTRPHEAPLKVDLAKLARQKRTPSTKPMSSDRIYNIGLVEETGRTQLISPPPEETLAFRRVSRSTPSSLLTSSASKRKRNVPQPQQPQQPLQPIEATPNPKPRKQTRRQSTPIESPTRPQSTPSRSSRSTLLPKSPHALNPNADFVPPTAPRSARARRTTPIPPYEPPSDVFTPPREVMMTPTISKSSKRKTGTRPKPKSTAKPFKVVLPIKKELPDIDLSLPMPPASPTDDPLLLSGPLMPPTSTPTRAPRQRRHIDIINSASLALSPVPEPTPAPAPVDPLPPSSEPDPLPSSGAEPPIYFNWDASQSPTSEYDDSMDLDPADADVPAPAPFFPPSTWTEADAGGWSDSDDDTPGPAPVDAIEVGEGEFTGRFHTLSVRTKLDPPSSATRVRMEDWGRPITPFPRKIARPDFMTALDEGKDDAEAAQDIENQDIVGQASYTDVGRVQDADTEQVEDADFEMAGEEDAEDEEEREVREMSVPPDTCAGATDEEEPSFNDNEPSQEEELPLEEPSFEGQSYNDEEPPHEQGTNKAANADNSSLEDIDQDASVDETDASFEIPLPPPPKTPTRSRAVTPTENETLGTTNKQKAEEEYEQDNISEHQADVSLEIEVERSITHTNHHPVKHDSNYQEGDTKSHHSNDNNDEEEAEEREVRDMSVSYDNEDEAEEEPTSFITFSPTTPAPSAAVFSPPLAPYTLAPVLSSPPPTTVVEDIRMRDERGDFLGPVSRHETIDSHYEPRSVDGDTRLDVETEADSDDSFSDTEVEPDVVRITSSDPRAAARAAAILKQARHDYDCYTKLILRQKDGRRKTIVGGGVHKPKTPAEKQRRATLGTGMGVLGDRVYIPGTPTMTLPELLREAEAQVAGNTPAKRASVGTLLSGRKASFGTPLIMTPVPRQHSSAAIQAALGEEQVWTREEWKLLDACFTEERLERGLNGTLASVDAVHTDDVVTRFFALFDDAAPWDRSSVQQRVKALQNKQRAGNVAPPTTPYTPVNPFGITRRIPSMEVPDFTPLGRRALPPRKQRPIPAPVADAITNPPFANMPAEEPKSRMTVRKMPASLLAPRYSHLLEEAVAISLQPTAVADASVAGIETQETASQGDIDVDADVDVDDAPSEADSTPADNTTNPAAPEPTPSTLGTRVKGFLFSYLPRSKAPAGASKLKPKHPAQPGLPLPPPAILSKPRGPINTPIRAPAPKPIHPRDLVNLQPAPAPPRTTKIPRATRPQRLVELHPPPAPAPVVVPRPRRSSGGSVKDLVRSFEQLDEVRTEAKKVELKRVKSVGEWRKGLGGKVSSKPGWKP